MIFDAFAEVVRQADIEMFLVDFASGLLLILRLCTAERVEYVRWLDH